MKPHFKNKSIKEIFGDKVCNHSALSGSCGDKNKQSFCSLKSYIAIEKQELEKHKKYIEYLEQLSNENTNVVLPLFWVEDTYNIARANGLSIIEKQLDDWNMFYKDCMSKRYIPNIVDVKESALKEREDFYNGYVEIIEKKKKNSIVCHNEFTTDLKRIFANISEKSKKMFIKH